MPISFFKQRDIDEMDPFDIPEEFINYFDSLSEKRKKEIIENKPELAAGVGYHIANSVETEQKEKNNIDEIIQKDITGNIDTQADALEDIRDEFSKIRVNMYADSDLEKALVDGANPIEVLTVPEHTEYCRIHRKKFEKKQISYRSPNGSVYGMVVLLCRDCKRIFQEESKVKIVDKRLTERKIQHTFYDLDLTTRYLRKQMPVYLIGENEKLYIPDVWVEEKPTCPVHDIGLYKIPCEKHADNRKVSFTGYLCDKCNKVLVRKAEAYNLVDMCAVAGVSEIDTEELTKKAPVKRVIPQKDIKPDFYIQDGKRVTYNYGYTANCYKLTEEDTVIISDSVYCNLEGHNTEEVLALIIMDQKRGGKKAYLFMVGYCSHCQKYYMEEKDYRAIYAIGRPEVTIRMEDDSDLNLITSGEVFNQERKHLSDLEEDIRVEISDICNQPDYVNPFKTGDYDDGNLAYDKEISKHKYGEKLERLSGYIQKPYSYRVDITNGEYTETYYIGASDVELENGIKVISYNDDLGHELVNYKTLKIKKNEKEYNVKLSRQFDIDNATLYGYVNLRTDEDAIFRSGVTDPFLVRVLNIRKRQHNLVDIIATIQENQNKIVEAEFKKNIIVQGCAGSGKTMVLLHRLSSLQYKHQQFAFSDFALILTPNEKFSLHIKGLAEELQIGSIQRLSVEQYYIDMLLNYSDEFKPTNKLVSEMAVKQKYVDFIYSDEFREKFDISYRSVIEKRNKLVENVNDLAREMNQPERKIDLSLDSNVIAQIQYALDVLDRLVQTQDQKLENAKAELDKVQYRKQFLAEKMQESKIWTDKTVKEAMPRVYTKIGERVSERKRTLMAIDDEISALNKEKERIQNGLPMLEKREEIVDIDNEIKKLEKRKNKEIKMQSEENSIFELSQKEKDDDEIIEWMEQVVNYASTVRDELRLCKNATEEYSKYTYEFLAIDENIDLAQRVYDEALVSIYSDEIRDNISFLHAQILEYSVTGTYQKVFEQTVGDFKTANGITLVRGKYHKYDLYAELLFAIKFFNNTYGTTRFMCIDEGQDLALNEYKLLKRMNQNNLIFNIFGDTSQLLKPGRGIADWTEVKSLLSADEYCLQENYRNTNQITRFCNDSFDMNVLQTGVDGAKVREIARGELESELSSLRITTERIAILLPRVVRKTKYLQNDLLSEEIASIINGSMENGTIALMYVDEVKGIEFDRVYVVGNRMSRNEKYIAYTRALSELIIVVDENIPDIDEPADAKTDVGELVDFLRNNDIDAALQLYDVLSKEWTLKQKTSFFVHLFARVNQRERLFIMMGQRLTTSQIDAICNSLADEQIDSMHKKIYGKKLRDLLMNVYNVGNIPAVAYMVEFFGAWNKIDDFGFINKQELLLYANSPVTRKLWIDSLSEEQCKDFFSTLINFGGTIKPSLAFQICIAALENSEIDINQILDTIEYYSRLNGKDNEYRCPDDVIIALVCAVNIELYWSKIYELTLKCSAYVFSDKGMRRYPQSDIKPKILHKLEKLVDSKLTLDKKIFIYMNTALRADTQIDRFLNLLYNRQNIAYEDCIRELRNYWLCGTIKYVTEDGFVRIAPSNVASTRLLVFCSKQFHINGVDGKWVDPKVGDKIFFLLKKYDMERSLLTVHYLCIETTGLNDTIVN